MSETTTQAPVLKKEGEKQSITVYDKSNSWFDGEKWIPVRNMTKEHLISAKKFAQGKEEYFFHKQSEFGEKVDMLNEEAKRRGITLPNRRSSFQSNTSRRNGSYKTL